MDRIRTLCSNFQNWEELIIFLIKERTNYLANYLVAFDSMNSETLNSLWDNALATRKYYQKKHKMIPNQTTNFNLEFPL